jgi:hypothetical protein
MLALPYAIKFGRLPLANGVILVAAEEEFRSQLARGRRTNSSATWGL